MDYLNNRFLKIFYNAELWMNLLEKAIIIILTLVVASVAIKILIKIVDYVMSTQNTANKKFKIKINEKRSETLHKLINSTIKYFIYIISFFQILSTLGVNTTSIIASASIASVAIGFGAQSLVKDVISGFFIILEGQFDVGDNVKVYNQSAFIAGGNVLSLGLRSTKIISKSGEVYFIPNGSINQVVNYSLTFNLAMCDFPISITESLAEVEEKVKLLLERANNDEGYKKLLYKTDKLHIDFIEKIEDNVAHINVIGKAKVGKKLALETMLRRDFYNEFKERLQASEDK